LVRTGFARLPRQAPLVAPIIDVSFGLNDLNGVKRLNMFFLIASCLLELPIASCLIVGKATDKSIAAQDRREVNV